jgi:hypothetical protein
VVVGENPPATYRGCLMTTWHARESLNDALFFLLHCTAADEEFAPEGIQAFLIISVASIAPYAAIQSSVRGLM